MTRQPVVARRAEELLGAPWSRPPRSPAATSPPPPSCGSATGRPRWSRPTPRHPPASSTPRPRPALAGRGRRRRRRARVLADDSECLILRWVEPPARRRSTPRPPSASRSRHPRRRRRAFGPGRRRLHRPAAAAQPDGALWPEFYATRRVLPYLKLARDRGRSPPRTPRRSRPSWAGLTTLLPEEPPARLHGDLWNGNVLWGHDGAGPGDRPGGVRRPPRGRPRHAVASSGCPTCRGSWTPTTRWRRSPTAGRTGSAAPAVPAARARLPVRRRLRRPGRHRRDQARLRQGLSTTTQPVALSSRARPCELGLQDSLRHDWHSCHMPDPARVLVVDDDRAVRESLRRSLEFNGYDVAAGRRRRRGARRRSAPSTPTSS